jgi:hypothetical protein
MVAAQIGTPAAEGVHPGRRPRRYRAQSGLAPDLGEHGRDLLVGQFLDESAQLIPLTTHTLNRTRHHLVRAGDVHTLPATGAVA